MKSVNLGQIAFCFFLSALPGLSDDTAVADFRRILLGRARAFAAEYRARGDAESRFFAEQSEADASTIEEMMKEAEALRALSPVEAKEPELLDVRDFGAKGDGLADDADAFAKACEAIRALGGRPSVLRVPAGTYRFETSRKTAQFQSWNGASWWDCGYCVFDSITNCLIAGDGPTNTFIRTGMHGKSFLLANCCNCRVRGLEISLERLPYIEGSLEDYDAKTRTGVVRLAPGSLAPDDESWTPRGVEEPRLFECFGALFDPQGLFVQDAAFLNWGPEHIGERLEDGRWRLRFNDKTYREFLDAASAGRSIVIPNRYNGLGGMYAIYCYHCTIEDVWVRTCRAAAFTASKSRGTVFRRCRDFPPEGHILASNADGCFMSAGSMVIDCVFDSMCDDGLNVRTYAELVERTDRDDTVLRRETGLGRNRAGEVAIFADALTAAYIGSCTVAEDSEPFHVKDKGWFRRTRFTAPLPERAVNGVFMYFPRQYGIGTVISGSTFRNGRLSGLVLQTECILVENCTFEHIRASGIRMGALGDFKEGPPPYNVLIRNCRISDCRTGITSWIRMWDATKTAWSKELASPMRGIELYGNMFDASVQNPYSLSHVLDVRTTAK